MTLRFDYFKFEYDDALPAFVEVDDKHFLHRPTSRFLDRVNLTARWTADGYTPHAKEVGKADEWLWKHFTIGAPGGGGGGAQTPPHNVTLAKLAISADNTHLVYTPGVWDGNPRPTVTATLHVDGADGEVQQPITSQVAIDAAWRGHEAWVKESAVNAAGGPEEAESNALTVPSFTGPPLSATVEYLQPDGLFKLTAVNGKAPFEFRIPGFERMTQDSPVLQAYLPPSKTAGHLEVVILDSTDGEPQSYTLRISDLQGAFPPGYAGPEEPTPPLKVEILSKSGSFSNSATFLITGGKFPITVTGLKGAAGPTATIEARYPRYPAVAADSSVPKSAVNYEITFTDADGAVVKIPMDWTGYESFPVNIQHPQLSANADGSDIAQSPGVHYQFRNGTSLKPGRLVFGVTRAVGFQAPPRPADVPIPAGTHDSELAAIVAAAWAGKSPHMTVTDNGDGTATALGQLPFTRLGQPCFFILEDL